MSGWVNLLLAESVLRLSSLDLWLCVTRVVCLGWPCIKGLKPFHGLSQCGRTRSVCQARDPQTTVPTKFDLLTKCCILKHMGNSMKLKNLLLVSFDTGVTDPSLRLLCEYMAKPGILEWIAMGWSITTLCHRICHPMKLPASAISTAANCDHKGQEYCNKRVQNN